VHRRRVSVTHVEADGADAVQVADHRGRDGVAQAATAPVAPRVDVADGGGVFVARHQVRAGRRHQVAVLVDAVEHAVHQHRREEEVRRFAG